MRRSLRTLVWLSAVFLLAVSGRAATRVALVSTCERRSVENVMALAEAKLAQEDGLALVERAQIEKVLREQESCELFDGQRAVTVGRLLNAEIFAVVENYAAERQAVAFVAFDALTGVRLWDEVLPEEDAETTAHRIVLGVRMAAQKRSAVKGGLNTVCLLAVRNVDLPIEKDTVCQSVGMLVERQLLNSEAIAVLERKRLEFVNQERSLPLESFASGLFLSLITMDLEISRASPRGGMRASIVFSDAKGKQLDRVSASVDSDDAAQLAKSLVEQIAQFLHVAAVPPLEDRVQEANRFLGEGEYLSGHRDVWGALNAVESAHALNPDDLITQARLAHYLIDAGTDILTNRPAVKRSLRMAARTLEIETNLRQRQASNTVGFISELDETEGLLTSYVRRKLRQRGLNLNVEDQQLTGALKAGLRHLRVTLVAVPAAARARDPRSFYQFASEVGNLQIDLADLCPSSQEWTSDILKLLELYLDGAGRFTPYNEWQLMQNRVLLQLSCQALGRPPAEQEQFLALLERMKRHPDQLVQIYGRIGRLHLEQQMKGLSSEQIRPRYVEIKKFIRDKITQPDREPQRVYRLLSYLAALDAIDLFVERADRQLEYQDLFEFMVARAEVEVMTASRVIKADGYTFEQYRKYLGGLQGCKSERNKASPAEYPRLLKNCERMIALTGSPESYNISGTFFTWQLGSAEAVFLELRQRLLKLVPELAPKPVLPWSKTTLLYDGRSGSGPRRIQRTLVTDEAVYVLEGSVKPTGLALVKVPLTGAAPTVLGVFPRCELAGEPCLANGKLYIGTESRGVLACALDGGEIEQIDESAGFVNGGIESFACVGGKLYAALKDRSSILAYDLKTRQSRLVVSGNRKDAQSPLDNMSRPFQVPFMIADHAKHRVIFTTSLHDEPYGGLWQIDAATDEITRILPLTCTVRLVGEHRQNHLLLHTACVFGGMYDRVWSPAGVVDFDLVSDKATLLAAFDWRYGGPTIEFPETQVRIGTRLQDVLLVPDGKLWFRQAQDRLGILSATSRVADEIPAAPEYGGACGIWDKVRLLSNGQLLAANPCGIWLLDVPPSSVVAATRAVESPVPVAAEGETSLEIESFRLTNARIEPLAGAGGGEVVRLDPVTGRAFQVVELPAGRYEFMLYASSARFDDRAARLQFDFDYSNGDRNTRLNCDQTNQIAVWRKNDPPGPVIREMKSPGQVKLLLSSLRSDIVFDRLVIRPVPIESKDPP